MLRKAISIAIFGAMLPLAQARAWTVEVETPAFAELRSPIAKIDGKAEKGRYRLDFPEATNEAILEIRGPLGGYLTYRLTSADAGKTIRFDTAMIDGPDPNPAKLSNLPSLCPRIERQAKGAHLYRGESDSLNRFPITHMTDPDKAEGRQAESVRLIDGQNVLLLKSIRLTYDYEDDAIVDEKRIDAKGNTVEVREGQGGFYANFHFAVVPYDPAILQLPEQTLLHLAQGSLASIGQPGLRPELRTHGFFPGPFLSRSSFGYPLCEWGDTAWQAPEQSLEYRGIALWDWDYSVASKDRILLIVWEGDEEEQARAQGLIDANRITDDLVGVFEISRHASRSPLRLQNSQTNFEITVQSGDFPQPPTPQAPSLPLAEKPALISDKPAAAMNAQP